MQQRRIACPGVGAVGERAVHEHHGARVLRARPARSSRRDRTPGRSMPSGYRPSAATARRRPCQRCVGAEAEHHAAAEPLPDHSRRGGIVAQAGDAAGVCALVLLDHLHLPVGRDPRRTAGCSSRPSGARRPARRRPRCRGSARSGSRRRRRVRSRPGLMRSGRFWPGAVPRCSIRRESRRREFSSVYWYDPPQAMKCCQIAACFPVCVSNSEVSKPAVRPFQTFPSGGS